MIGHQPVGATAAGVGAARGRVVWSLFSFRQCLEWHGSVPQDGCFSPMTGSWVFVIRS